jgi:hypothetical protein
MALAAEVRPAEGKLRRLNNNNNNNDICAATDYSTRVT